jgi:hypothetical protein
MDGAESRKVRLFRSGIVFKAFHFSECNPIFLLLMKLPKGAFKPSQTFAQYIGPVRQETFFFFFVEMEVDWCGSRLNEFINSQLLTPMGINTKVGVSNTTKNYRGTYPLLP